MSKAVDLLKFTNNINNNLIAFTSNIESSVISTIDSSTINTFVGMIASFSMTTTSEWRTTNRWIICDGSAISRTVYSDLFSVISTTWGVGDGSSTFNLPDLRGEFLRGLSNSSGNDPDAANRSGGDSVGSSQTDAFQGHRHGISHNARKWAGIYRGGGPSYAADQIANITITDPTDSGSHGTVRVASETRPKNKYVQFCIKY